MAGTITWEQLRELAAFHAGHAWAVSLYVGRDPTTGDPASRIRTLLTRAERHLAGRSVTLSHDERHTLARDIGRISAWLEREFGHEESSTGICGTLPRRSIAAFAASGMFASCWPGVEET